MNSQLWQTARITKPAEMIGNASALAALRAVESGFVLIEGPIGCGKTSLALAWAREKFGVPLEESTVFSCPGEYYVRHCHASDFEVNEATQSRLFFWWHTPTILIVDEAQELLLKRQQSRLKTIPARQNLTLVLVTSEPEQIEKSIRDRCTRIRLGPLSARELKPMVERACGLRGIPYDSAILPALNRAGIFRPRAILNVVEAVANGVPVEQACVGQVNQ